MKDAPKNVVASVLARLRTVAEKGGLTFNDVLQSYVSERFLARLARSPDAQSVLLKGALMLRVWGVPRARPTLDIDLLRRGNADRDELVKLVKQCAAAADEADGVTFDPESLDVEAIHEDSGYVGTRIRLDARLDNVRQVVQIDFGVGDAVFPEPRTINYPVLLGGSPLKLRAYPVEATIAEKFEAMVRLDLKNSRMKDFYDIWTLSRALEFAGQRVSGAIRATFERRETPIPMDAPPALTEKFFVDPAHVRQWSAFVQRIAEPELIDQLPTVIEGVSAFVMPPARRAAAKKSFDANWLPPGPWIDRHSREDAV